MTAETTWIGLILLLIFIGPIIYLLVRQKINHRNHIKVLKNLCDVNNILPDFNEISGAYLIGLDSKERKLIYLRAGEQENYKLIDLNEYASCKIGSTKISETEAENVWLKLNNKSQHQLPMEIIFYDNARDMHLDSDVQFVLAQKWQAIIRQNLTK